MKETQAVGLLPVERRVVTVRSVEEGTSSRDDGLGMMESGGTVSASGAAEVETMSENSGCMERAVIARMAGARTDASASSKGSTAAETVVVRGTGDTCGVMIEVLTGALARDVDKAVMCCWRL